MTDLDNYKPGEDLRFYLSKCEFSYLGSQPDDVLKIFHLINKFQDCEPLFRTALGMRHFKSYKYFKNGLLDEHAKSEDIIAMEFEQM